MEVHKAFVTLDNLATLTCPKCHKSKTIPVEKYRKGKHEINVRCSCGHLFTTLLDFRRHYRKETNLEGTYSMLPPAYGAGRLNILNISRSGVGFTIGFSVTGKHAMQVGQMARIIFELDNKRQSVVEKLIKIQSVNDTYIGGMFEENQVLDKDLGFYLQP